MTNPYKVDYLQTLELRGKKNFIQYHAPVDEMDLTNQLEALLIERDGQGYELFQIVETKSNHDNGKRKNGLLIIFKLKKAAS